MSGTMTFSCAGYERCEREIFPARPMPGALRPEACGEAVSGFYGFGVAITPSSCYHLAQMSAPEREKLLRHLYGKEGLGLSVGRICVGSSDYSPEIYSYDDVEGDVTLSHFSVKRDEAYIIPMIKEILAINPDLYLFASPWSPPYWMKTGGSMCGGYMRDKYLEPYAEYLIKFIKAYAAHGIRISALTPQNETNTQQRGRMPACIWHPETEAKFISLLRRRLEENGLDVKIWMYDHNFDDTARVMWSLANCEGLRESCNGVAFHYYGGAIEQTAAVRRAYPELELHFSEGGPRLNDHYDSDLCKWGLMIARAIRVGYRSFSGWNLMLDELGGPNVGPFLGTCGGLVTRDSRTGELRFSGQYKVFAYIAPHVTPQSVLRYICLGQEHGANLSNYPASPAPIEGILIENPGGEQIAVLVNPREQGAQVQLELGGQLYYAELYAQSVCTIKI